MSHHLPQLVPCMVTLGVLRQCKRGAEDMWSPVLSSAGPGARVVGPDIAIEKDRVIVVLEIQVYAKLSRNRCPIEAYP